MLFYLPAIKIQKYSCFVVISLIVKNYAQILRNSYPSGPDDDKWVRPYPSDYYDRYPGNDRINNWQRSQYLPTGKDSVYSDRRCFRDSNLNSELPGPVQVTTRLGYVEGTYVYLCDWPGLAKHDRPKDTNTYITKDYKNITIFLGIPYAKPPTRSLRFRAPQVQPSFGLKKTLQYQSACPQTAKYTGSNLGVGDINEDCLYLNIFSPSVEKFSNIKYAVMIYIHGGEWDHGSANTFPAHMLCYSQQVVVVTFNYRLGSLGFYATGQNSSAGNFGLLDQAMAIEWVYDNIDVFNGDNTKITLFGPGVGAASAGIHALSNRLGKKIRRVIAQSGAAVANWAVSADNDTIFNNSLEFAMQYNCHFQSSWRTVDCLRSEDLNLFLTTPFKPKVGWVPWIPVVDICTRDEKKRILADLPENLIRYSYDNLHYDFSYMAGITRDEAISMILQDDELSKNNFIITKETFEKKIEEYPKMYNFTRDVPALIKAIKFMYMPRDRDLHNQTLLKEGYINMLSDSYFIAPNDKMLKLLLSRNVRTFMYVLNNTLEGLKTIQTQKSDMFTKYVPHDSEYYLITGAPFMDPHLYPNDLRLDKATWTEADRNMSEFFMAAWANFAKFGNPTPAEIFNIKWKPMELKNMQYLSINTTNYTTVMMSNFRQRESQFWNYFVPNLMKLDLPPSTYCRPIYEEWEIQKNVYESSLWGVVGAVGLFLILSILCCCLYCRAKSKHIVSTEDIPDAVSVTPSSIDTLLNMKKLEARSKYFPQHLSSEQKHTQV